MVLMSSTYYLVDTNLIIFKIYLFIYLGVLSVCMSVCVLQCSRCSQRLERVLVPHGLEFQIVVSAGILICLLFRSAASTLNY